MPLRGSGRRLFLLTVVSFFLFVAVGSGFIPVVSLVLSCFCCGWCLSFLALSFWLYSVLMMCFCRLRCVRTLSRLGFPRSDEMQLVVWTTEFLSPCTDLIHGIFMKRFFCCCRYLTGFWSLRRR